MASFGIVRTGVGGTTANTLANIGGVITMPAGGPYTIYGIWAQIAKITTIPDEKTGGFLKFEALSGDLTPDPAPGKFPLIGNHPSASADAAAAANPLNIWPTRFQASGKATIQLSYLNDSIITTAPQVLAGILFGTEVPTAQPHVFVDSVEGEFASASEQTLGSIVLAEKAKKITGILAILSKPGATTDGEAVAATIRLDSVDVKLQPAEYPCNVAYDAEDGTQVGALSSPQSQFIPVNIPILPGSTINVLATTTVSVTNNASIRVFLAYE